MVSYQWCLYFCGIQARSKNCFSSTLKENIFILFFFLHFHVSLLWLCRIQVCVCVSPVVFSWNDSGKAMDRIKANQTVTSFQGRFRESWRLHSKVNMSGCCTELWSVEATKTLIFLPQGERIFSRIIVIQVKFQLGCVMIWLVNYTLTNNNCVITV